MNHLKCENCGASCGEMGFCSWFCSLFLEEKNMALNDKIPDDGNDWEGSTCAACGGNEVKDGKFVTPHKDDCPDKDLTYELPDEEDDEPDTDLEREDCPECNGQGWVDDEEDGGTKCCPADCDNGKI